MKCIVQGKRKRWEDKITEWTGEALSDYLRRAQDWEEWRELDVRCSDAPTVVSWPLVERLKVISSCGIYVVLF